MYTQKHFLILQYVKARNPSYYLTVNNQHLSDNWFLYSACTFVIHQGWVLCGCVSQELESTGLLTSDPRLRDCMQQLHHAVQESVGTAMMDQELFRK